jgi:hypothetical protein
LFSTTTNKKEEENRKQVILTKKINPAVCMYKKAVFRKRSLSALSNKVLLSLLFFTIYLKYFYYIPFL